jgi:hypothetical protein
MSVAVPSVTSKVGTIEATQLHDVPAGPHEHLRGLADHSCTFHLLAFASTMISSAASVVSLLCKGWSTDQPSLSMKKRRAGNPAMMITTSTARSSSRAASRHGSEGWPRSCMHHQGRRRADAPDVPLAAPEQSSGRVSLLGPVRVPAGSGEQSPRPTYCCGFGMRHVPPAGVDYAMSLPRSSAAPVGAGDLGVSMDTHT